MNTENDNNQRLENLPISFFSIIMGLAGLTIAWSKAQHILEVNWHITPVFLGATSIVFLLLVALYTAKFLKHPEAVFKELRHPIKLSFFPTISISLILLSIGYLDINTGISQILWISGASIHLLLTLYIFSTWIHHQHFDIKHLNPAWFIPAVGNVLVPIAGMPLGYTEISWFFFSVGILFWIVLLTIIFYRMLFHHPMDEKLMPTLFILIAPPAVGFIAYLSLTGDLDSFARILYFTGLFMTLLLFTQVRYFARLNFYLSWWAYSFPMAAITIASMAMYEKSGVVFYCNIGGLLLMLLTAIVGLLLYRTGVAIKKKQICVPE